jgi:mannitol/fructose-specific phosphotransferase system IIA component (Ntr-type)
MRLGELLHEGSIKVNLQATTKKEAIEELVDLLVEAHEIPLSMRSHVLEIVSDREQEASTGMEYGIALPHGGTDRVEDMIVALGISPEGIPFQTRDGVTARIIILLIVPRRQFAGRVHTLGSIAVLFRDKTFRDELRAASDARTALRIIQGHEARQSSSSPAATSPG